MVEKWESGSPKTEVGRQKSEVGSWKNENGIKKMEKPQRGERTKPRATPLVKWHK
jgi:hypothetical protein